MSEPLILARRFGLALLIAAVLLHLEGMRVLSAAGSEVGGPWEGYVILRGAPAIMIIAAAAVLLVVVAFSAFAPLLARRRGRLAWAAAMAMIAIPLALELSTGPKARAPGVRIPFVLGLATLAAIGAGAVAPLLIGYARRRRWSAALIGALTIVVALEADRRVLPRLYPLFHHALLVVACVGCVLIAEGLTPERRRVQLVNALAALGILLEVYALIRLPRDGRNLAKYDNVRRILDERSAVLSRAVSLAAKRWPPPPLDDVAEGPDPLVASFGRTIDAGRRDLLLVTIDALRADHVGAYGYDKPVTPALDALAAEGTLFERAYTATPHTSYAISSLMTGKYMRPVLALEAASGGGRRPDETWAGLLRTYGFRTAAFFPEAVWAVDAQRFSALIERKLDFEYYKIEFAAPDLRAKQVADYLASAPRDKPLFVWVHLFEPHEPYVAHPGHPFGDHELGRYDSEIAAADAGLGAIVRDFRASRPGAIVIVSADHGEAFGEHGARYHGTTVYEEQVRVPLVVSAPGLVARRRIARPVQLVDLLPTALSAYGIPKPPRVRGLDLGPLLDSREPPPGEGIAFSEVEDMAMLARGSLRLVCNRRTSTCPLYDLATDPGQLVPVPSEGRAERMRKEMAAVLAGSARLEGASRESGSDAASWPEALRRGFVGDADAAIEVAGLLDDVDVAFRRRAAEVLVRLAHPGTEAHVRRALGRETDPSARTWLMVARLRTAHEHPATAAEVAAVAPLLQQQDKPEVMRWAALAMGEALAAGRPSPGPAVHARAFDVLVDWFPTARADAELGRAILRALPAALRGSAGTTAKRATPALLDALGDVRLRVEAARTLGALVDPAAGPVLDKRLAGERHVDARVPLALALSRVGFPERAMPHIVRFLGVPEPPPGAADAMLTIARELPPTSWLGTIKAPSTTAKIGLIVPSGKAHRLVVVGAKKGEKLRARVLGVEIEGQVTDAGGIVELGDRLRKVIATPLLVEATTSDGAITALALVPRVDDLPPPKKDRGLEDEDAAP